MAVRRPVVVGSDGLLQQLQSGDTLNIWRFVDAAADRQALPGDFVRVDCAGGPRVITLPAAPADGSRVAVLDATGSAAANAITIARNGARIQGVAADRVLKAAGQMVELLYVAGRTDWRIVNAYPAAWSA